MELLSKFRFKAQDDPLEYTAELKEHGKYHVTWENHPLNMVTATTNVVEANLTTGYWVIL